MVLLIEKPLLNDNTILLIKYKMKNIRPFEVKHYRSRIPMKKRDPVLSVRQYFA